MTKEIVVDLKTRRDELFELMLMAKREEALAMLLTTAENIRSLRAEIDAQGLGAKVQLAVDGAVFKLRPELMLAGGI
jgi:hypothetical protein